MPTDWLSGDNPSVLLTCLLTVGAATAVMYFSAEVGSRKSRLETDAQSGAAALAPKTQKSPQEQAA